MDITKKYVLHLLHESVQKNEDELGDLQTGADAPVSGNLDAGMQNPTIEMPAADTELSLEEDASDWSFDPEDQGMSGCATYTCTNKVVIEDTGFMNAGANILSPDDNAEEFVGMETENMLALLYCPGEETPYGFHFEIFEPSLQVYDYAMNIEELKEIMEQKLLRYTNYDIEDVPFAEFEAKLAEVQQPAEEVEESIEEVDEASDDAKHYTDELIEMVNNDADLLLWYLRRHLSEDGYRYFYEYVKEQTEQEASDIKATTDAAFDNAEEA